MCIRHEYCSDPVPCSTLSRMADWLRYDEQKKKWSLICQDCGSIDEIDFEPNNLRTWVCWNCSHQRRHLYIS